MKPKPTALTGSGAATRDPALLHLNKLTTKKLSLSYTNIEKLNITRMCLLSYKLFCELIGFYMLFVYLLKNRVWAKTKLLRNLSRCYTFKYGCYKCSRIIYFINISRERKELGLLTTLKFYSCLPWHVKTEMSSLSFVRCRLRSICVKKCTKMVKVVFFELIHFSLLRKINNGFCFVNSV